MENNEQKKSFTDILEKIFFYIAIFLISLSVLGYELILNRMFALRYWYHFAFMIISIALFGIGIGGLLVFFINKLFKNVKEYVLYFFALLLGISITGSLIIINHIPFEIELISKFAQQIYFVEFFLVLSLPFILFGFLFSYIFTNYNKDINRIYFFDLVGGGFGCFFILLTFPHRGPYPSAFIVSILIIFAAGLFLFKKIKWYSFIPTLLLMALSILFIYPNIENINIKISKYKTYVYPLHERIYHDWDDFGYVGVYEKDNLSKIATVNFSSFANMFDTHTSEKLKNFAGFDVTLDHYYPYVLIKKPDDVGIIGVGAGKDILIAYNAGSKNIYGAEFSPTMYDLAKTIFTQFTGNIVNRSNVHYYRAEGRFFIRSSERKYDILAFDNAIALSASSSGAFALAEGYLYTVESMIDYINHLKPNGLLYLSNPFPDYMRFITILREAYKRMGREDEFKNSIIVADNTSKVYRRCKVIAKNGIYTPDEVGKMKSFINSIKQKYLYLPYSKSTNYATALITTTNIGKKYLTCNQEIRPSTDDWPYYSQSVKFSDKSLKWAEKNPSKYYSEPFLILRTLIKYVTIFSMILLLFPLILFNLKGFKELNNKIGSIIYFASLGLGFMLMEIVLMQKYMMVLGHPVYSFSVVLSSLLISSGIGSIVSKRINDPLKAIQNGLTGIIISTVVAFIFYKFVGSAIISASVFIRFSVIILLTSFSGFFMGFMMPSGIRFVSVVENSIPWLWSINSLFSVAAGFLAMYLSILYGFTSVLLASVLCYIAGVFFIQIGRKKIDV